tara:strand:- start:1788 stop:2390 length:603 start_codon:yes stop_codon:yes gene_type:complete
MKIGIINLEINNIKSVKDFFSIFGNSYLINDFSEYKENTDLVILPGNGTFKAGVESIKNKGIDKLLIKILNEKIFLIGICLGMQLLFEKSDENPKYQGLSFFKGVVKEIETNNCRLPLLGWYELNSKKVEQNRKTFFFNNKYSCLPKDNSYSESFLNLKDYKVLASIRKDNIYGLQFHPEKSSSNGRELISKIIDEIKNV